MAKKKETDLLPQEQQTQQEPAEASAQEGYRTDGLNSRTDVENAMAGQTTAPVRR